MADELDSAGLDGRVASRGLSPRQLVRLGAAASLVFAVAVFVLQNLDSVPVEFLSFSFDVPLVLLVLVAAVAGVMVQWMLRVWRHRRNR